MGIATPGNNNTSRGSKQGATPDNYQESVSADSNDSMDGLANANDTISQDDDSPDDTMNGEPTSIEAEPTPIEAQNMLTAISKVCHHQLISESHCPLEGKVSASHCV